MRTLSFQVPTLHPHGVCVGRKAPKRRGVRYVQGVKYVLRSIKRGVQPQTYELGNKTQEPILSKQEEQVGERLLPR